MDASPIIVWLRRDLRLADNPALAAAAVGPVVLVHILEDGEEIGGAARWWLHRSLADLGRRAPLLLRRGEPARVLTELAAETKAAAVHWNRRYSPAGAARDRAVATALAEAGVAVRDFPGDLLFEPWTVRSRAGEPFRVFTPFWTRCQEHQVAAPVGAPD
ncbi:MAG: deoxyribodipyrimidine photo-lyase, partial [Alphaproteobacteria bacterium]|nr:deoxyribodipyrimidine photo-lyase [Alphaproteobacteria bacterium]